MGRRSARLRAGQEAGYSLVELLVVIGILGVIGSITLTIMISAFRTQRTQVEHVDALNTAKIAMERFTRDIRGADPLVAATPNSIEVTLATAVAGSTFPASPPPTRTRTWVVATVGGSRNLYRCTVPLASCTGANRQLVAAGIATGYDVLTYWNGTSQVVGNPLTSAQRLTVGRVVVDIRIPRSGGRPDVAITNSVDLRNVP